jgi:hypothetical protein
MNNKLSPAVVCGFAAAVLTTIPSFKQFACCLIIPFAVYFSLIVNQKIAGLHKVNSSEAVSNGLLTGLFAALFGTLFEVLITYILKTNEVISGYAELEKWLRTFPPSELITLLINNTHDIVYDITTKGFSLYFSFSLLLSNLLINTTFGLIGGLVSMSILNKRNFPR